jgi:hypothetical protein
MKDYQKPLPAVDEGSRPFWEACKRGQLVVQQCNECGHRRWPLGPVCTQCLSPAHHWVELSGLGEVWSWIIYHHIFHPAFASDVPYNVALIRLEEGHTMISNVVADDLSSLRVGMKVRVVFDDVTPDISIPRFTPISEAGR